MNNIEIHQLLSEAETALISIAPSWMDWEEEVLWGQTQALKGIGNSLLALAHLQLNREKAEVKR